MSTYVSSIRLKALSARFVVQSQSRNEYTVTDRLEIRVRFGGLVRCLEPGRRRSERRLPVRLRSLVVLPRRFVGGLGVVGRFGVLAELCALLFLGSHSRARRVLRPDAWRPCRS